MLGRARRQHCLENLAALVETSRIAVPSYSVDWLPAVQPSSGVRAVSPETISTRANGRSSSSAAI